MQLETNYQSLISQLSQLSDEQLKRDYLNHLEWTQPIASMLPLIDDVEALRVVRLALDVDLMLGAFLAGRVKPELQSETVGWIRELEIYDELKLKLLTKTKSKVAVSFLEDFIKNIPDKPDKLHVYEISISQAVKELENIYAESFLSMTFNLLQDERQWIRNITIKLFKNYIDESAIPILIKLLKDEDVQIRYKAVIALGKIAGKSVLKNIVEALDDKSPTVRGIAISVLASIAGKDIIQKLIYLLNDEYCIVRSQTVRALGKIGGELAEELIIHAFLDKYDDVSKTAFEVLIKIDRNRAIQLIFLTSQSDDAKVRRKAALFLGNIVKTPDRVSDLPVLVELLNDENSQVRKTAAKALTLPKTGMESPKFEALREEYKELRWKAEIDIEEIINESDFTTLLLKSQDFNYYVRSAAKKILKYQIAAVKDIKTSFFKALLHENYLIRSAATTYLGKIYGKSVIQNLLKALQDEHPKVRSNAVLALTSIANKSTIPALLKALHDENSRVRALTARALGNITDDSTAIALIEALQDEEMEVRRAAVFSLSQIGGEQAIEAILASLPYKDNFIDRIAASILSKVGKIQYIPHLWNIQIKAKYKTYFCDAIEKIQHHHQRYNPEF